jgi:DNA-directed RNA polymerase subunit M/transcription elongation factor TFIIS
MDFCEVCNFLYYLTIDQEDPNKLLYVCHHCGNKNEELVKKGLCIVNEQYKGKKLEMSHLINPYTKLDPTLPRIWNIRCPSPDCETNHGDKVKEPAEIIYMKYDAEDLKFLYLCVKCDTVWKTDN